MEHDDDVGAVFQRLDIAGFLVAAVAPVLNVDDHLEAELARDVDGFVTTDVVDEDHPIDDAVGQVAVGLFEGLCRVVGRHDHHDALLVRHSSPVHGERNDSPTILGYRGAKPQDTGSSIDYYFEEAVL